MNRRDDTQRSSRFVRWLARRTTLQSTARALADQPAEGFTAWARTTSGVVVLLLVVQMLTGVLLAFYYVPTSAHAHTTVAFIEKTLDAGSWIRALHFYGSQWLPLALALHLARMFWDGAYRRKPVGWLACIALLALTLAGGATGYSLPWDARAFFSTRVMASVAGGLPVIGESSRRWTVGASDISTLTLSRLYALHVLVLPALILAVAAARLFIFRDETTQQPNASTDADTDSTSTRAGAHPMQPTSARTQFARNAVVAGTVFLALSLYASKFPAPLGLPADAAPSGYLPRPGAQFLWLFQMLKYLPGALASLAAMAVPFLLLGGLALLPRLASQKSGSTSRPLAGTALFALGSLLVGGLTALAYLEDRRDPHVRQQLARQATAEEEFRRAPFEPLPPHLNAPDENAATLSPAPPPQAFTNNCVKCHGERGEGRSINPSLVGVAAKPRRSVEDIIAILNNPTSYGLESRMPSFAGKLTDDEKRAVALWITSLKK